MDKKILILGKGFIGTRLQDGLGCEISDELIDSYNNVEAVFRKHKPQIIINAIGYIGTNVDACEKDLDKTLSSNTFIPILLAEAALRNNIKLVHISSGCIYHYDYSEDTPINEDKLPDFFELFYSRTKIYSDQALLALSGKHPVLIARIRVPLDNRPHPRNILTKLINYKKVIDLPNSVTYIPDFIEALKHLINIDAYGIYNVVNKGGLRYPQLMQAYKKYFPGFEYETIDFKKLNLVRTNLILSTEKLEKSGFRVRGIQEVLEECIQAYKGLRESK
ncbi:MAG: sugar nucleotide-binding protein [Candidatus Omnitrophica bacterium]|nr:sugar nucleotide-binding protein [Candidatus Omnitrophota bacterium]